MAKGTTKRISNREPKPIQRELSNSERTLRFLMARRFQGGSAEYVFGSENSSPRRCDREMGRLAKE